MILNPRPLTWKLYGKILASPYSIIRFLEYERIKASEFAGKGLDIGGGKKADYNRLLRISGTLESVNIDSAMEPTFVADASAGVPQPANTYDFIISFNTLEHIHHDFHVIKEAFRVLKPGGIFTFAVPFLFRVHGSPSDFNRHTAFWWNAALQDAGFTDSQIEIEPLTWEPLGASLSISEFWWPWLSGQRIVRFFRKLLVLPLGPLLHSLRGWSSLERLPDPWGKDHACFAVGYWITARKEA